MKRLDKKVAIVTGASKGIGAAITKAFGAEGGAVIVNYARECGLAHGRIDLRERRQQIKRLQENTRNRSEETQT
jgi:NAD(P)-dependent dehydrogenase (short-subunit alcohol dehydrogenase family)